ncbi:MAG: EAL domain-containing protein [Brevibacillus sp.]|nr:EAL domain-containing protein [Brevibacillus sp.]
MINQQLEAVLHHITDAVDVVDTEGYVIKVNRSFERLYGWREEELVGKPLPIIPEERQEEMQKWKQQAAARHRTQEYQTVRRRKNGRSIPILLRVAAIRDEQGNILGYLTLSRKRAADDASGVFSLDSVTNLLNRSTGISRLKKALRAARRRDEPVSLLSIDVDRFKNLNDTLGYQTGDKLLKLAARRLVKAVGTHLMARAGADEFFVLLVGEGQPDETRRVTERILSAFSKPFTLNGHEVMVTVSIGISHFPYDAEDAETMLRHADVARQEARQQWGNSFQVYTSGMGKSQCERFFLEMELRKALEQKELEIYYQPIADIHSGRIVSLEALLRWNHKERGMISPASFIPLAEETGLIVPISEWVLRQACTLNKTLQEKGLPPIRVAVNLSARQFQRRSFPEVVEHILRETGLHPRFLELELTESVLMQNTDETVSVLCELKEIGPLISIDDFGTGYSSLSYLKRFPVNNVKIDRSFVRDIHLNRHDAAIVRAVVALAQELKLKVIAEGVEKMEEHTFLRQCGCDMVQGYLLSKPLPQREIEIFLQNGVAQGGFPDSCKRGSMDKG